MERKIANFREKRKAKELEALKQQEDQQQQQPR